MAKSVSKLEMTEEEWRAMRAGLVGASEVGAILGISTFDTPRDIYDVKLGLKPPFEGNDSTEWGTELEDFCTRMFEKKELATLMQSSGDNPRIRRDNKIRLHPEHQWAACNLDRLIVGCEEPIILELKTTTSFAMKYWDAAVPTTYYSQVQWQMFVTKYRKAIIWVAVLDTKKFVRLDVDYSEEFCTAMFAEVEKFHEAVLAKDPSTLKMLLPDIERFRPIEGSRIEATEEIMEKITRLTETKARKAETEKTEKALAAEIKTFIAENELLVQGDRVLATYKSQHKDAYTVPASDYRTLNLQREKKGKKP